MNRVKVLAVAVGIAAAALIATGCNSPLADGFSNGGSEKRDDNGTEQPPADSGLVDPIITEPGLPAGKIKFEAQYVRTGSVIGHAESPVVISSKAELDEYDRSIPSHRYSADGAASNGFTEYAAKYTDEFFKTKFLVIVPRIEPSGGNRHKVQSVDENGNIAIAQSLRGDTDDIAGWHIIIEMGNDSKLKEYTAVFYPFYEACACDPKIPVVPVMLTFNARYIEGYYPADYTGGRGYRNPVVTVVSSRADIERAYDDVDDLMYYKGFSSIAQYDKYTDDFFAKRFFVAVSFYASSGSHRFEVESVGADGHIVIKILGGLSAGTADVKNWTVLIELNNDFKREDYTVEFKPVTSEIPPTPPKNYGFTAQYIGTGSVIGHAESPVVISSKAELNEYDRSIPSHRYSADGAASNGFTEYAAKYTDEYFKTKFLVIVPRIEPSGGNRHRVESVGADGTISINVDTRGVTDDIAGWHIIIEMDNSAKLKEYRAVFTDRRVDGSEIYAVIKE